MKRNIFISSLTFAFLFFGLFSFGAVAMTAPAAGAKFKFISDLVVNDVVQGPIGYALAILCGSFSAGMLVMSKVLPAVGGIIGTAVLIGAPTLVESAGAVII